MLNKETIIFSVSLLVIFSLVLTDNLNAVFLMLYAVLACVGALVTVGMYVASKTQKAYYSNITDRQITSK